MPTYDLHCDGCGAEWEAEQRVADPPPPCPECGGREVRRLIGRTSFVLKGPRWARDRYGGSDGSAT